MLIRIETRVTWSPERDPKSKEPIEEAFQQTLVRQREFQARPSKGERVRIDGEMFHIAEFFHDLDANCLQVCLRPEFFHVPAEGRKRIAELEDKGWVKT
jgi:hypothetical protein